MPEGKKKKTYTRARGCDKLDGIDIDTKDGVQAVYRRVDGIFYCPFVPCKMAFSNSKTFKVTPNGCAPLACANPVLNPRDTPSIAETKVSG